MEEDAFNGPPHPEGKEGKNVFIPDFAISENDVAALTLSLILAAKPAKQNINSNSASGNNMFHGRDEGEGCHTEPRPQLFDRARSSGTTGTERNKILD